MRFVSGGPPHGAGEVALDAGTAADTGYHVGDRIPIATDQPVRHFRVSGLVRFGNASQSYPVT